MTPAFRRTDDRRRHGATLVLFAVLLFAFMSLLALVFDLGLVFLTRRQMQTAANAAALEGFRNIAATDHGEQDALSGAAATMPNGAGPSQITFSGGVAVDNGSYRALRTLILENPPISVFPTMTYSSDGATTVAVEFARTGTSAVPSLFRRGYLLGTSTEGQAFRDQIEQGYTVRASSIAMRRPALGIGAEHPKFPDIAPRVAPFVLEFSTWNANPSITISSITATGELVMSGVVVGQMIRATPLAADVSPTGGTLNVVLPQGGFPSVDGDDPIRVRIGDELLDVVAGMGTTSWTVTRAEGDTTASAHVTGELVKWVSPISVGAPIGDGTPMRPALGNFNAAITSPITAIPAESYYVPVYRDVSFTIGSSTVSERLIVGFGTVDVTHNPMTGMIIARSISTSNRNVSSRPLDGLRAPGNDQMSTRFLYDQILAKYPGVTDDEFANLINFDASTTGDDGVYRDYVQAGVVESLTAPALARSVP